VSIAIGAELLLRLQVADDLFRSLGRRGRGLDYFDLRGRLCVADLVAGDELGDLRVVRLDLSLLGFYLRLGQHARLLLCSERVSEYDSAGEKRDDGEDLEFCAARE
jgi:hypothetical protein